jgi:hypothetical protein
VVARLDAHCSWVSHSGMSANALLALTRLTILTNSQTSQTSHRRQWPTRQSAQATRRGQRKLRYHVLEGTVHRIRETWLDDLGHGAARFRFFLHGLQLLGKAFAYRDSVPAVLSEMCFEIEWVREAKRNRKRSMTDMELRGNQACLWDRSFTIMTYQASNGNTAERGVLRACRLAQNSVGIREFSCMVEESFTFKLRSTIHCLNHGSSLKLTHSRR